MCNNCSLHWTKRRCAHISKCLLLTAFFFFSLLFLPVVTFLSEGFIVGFEILHGPTPILITACWHSPSALQIRLCKIIINGGHFNPFFKSYPMALNLQICILRGWGKRAGIPGGLVKAYLASVQEWGLLFVPVKFWYRKITLFSFQYWIKSFDEYVLWIKWRYLIFLSEHLFIIRMVRAINKKRKERKKERTSWGRALPSSG